MSHRAIIFATVGFAIFTAMTIPLATQAQTDIGSARPVEERLNALETAPETVDLRTIDQTVASEIMLALLYQPDAGRLATALKAGLDANTPLEGSTPLHAAVSLGDDEKTRLLVDAGADLDSRIDDLTPLDLALAYKNWGSARIVSKDPDQTLYVQYLAALSDRSLDDAAAVMAELSDINLIGPDGETLLTNAVLTNASDFVLSLIEGGADTNAPNAAGATPLALAVATGAEGVIDWLLQANADPNQKHEGVPLLTIAVVGAEPLIELLLAAGADQDAKDAGGLRPADIAAALGKTELAARLGGATPGPEAAPSLLKAIRDDDISDVSAAINGGADVNGRTANGMPYLHLAVATASSEVVEILLSNGADLLAKSDTGTDVIDAALSRRYYLTQILKRMLASADARGQHYAFTRMEDRHGRSAAARIAAKKLAGASWDRSVIARTIVRSEFRDSSGLSAAEAAAAAGNTDFLEVLTSQGGSKLKYEPSLQDRARAEKNWEVLDALPFDRHIPKGFQKGASKDVKKEMQRRLKSWGYYKGGIDGVFGPQGRAALTAFLKDMDGELRNRAAQATGNTYFVNQKKSGNTTFRLTTKPRNSWCEWNIVEWTPKRNASEFFVGCVAGGKKWNSNGVSYVKYNKGSNVLIFHGSGGWEGNSSVR